MLKRKNVEEKEHMKLHIDLKGSLLRDVIVSTVDIVKESDLKMIILREKLLSAICGDSIWSLMTTAFVTELILESEGSADVELKNLERLMSDQEAADMLKLMIRFTPIPRGDGKSKTRFITLLALHKAVRALEERGK